MNLKTYGELKNYKTIEERFNYLKLTNRVGESTFGYDRYLNQFLYRSKKWRKTRDLVILRDGGNDMGLEGYRIGGRIIVHHINPLTIEDVEKGSVDIYEPEFLICVSNETHQAIHYSDASLLPKLPISRYPNDTIPWR